MKIIERYINNRQFIEFVYAMNSVKRWIHSEKKTRCKWMEQKMSSWVQYPQLQQAPKEFPESSQRAHFSSKLFQFGITCKFVLLVYYNWQTLLIFSLKLNCFWHRLITILFFFFTTLIARFFFLTRNLFFHVCLHLFKIWKVFVICFIGNFNKTCSRFICTVEQFDVLLAVFSCQLS